MFSSGYPVEGGNIAKLLEIFFLLSLVSPRASGKPPRRRSGRRQRGSGSLLIFLTPISNLPQPPMPRSAPFSLRLRPWVASRRRRKKKKSHNPCPRMTPTIDPTLHLSRNGLMRASGWWMNLTQSQSGAPGGIFLRPLRTLQAPDVAAYLGPQRAS